MSNSKNEEQNGYERIRTKSKHAFKNMNNETIPYVLRVRKAEEGEIQRHLIVPTH